MKRSGQLAVLAGAPLLIITVMALSALLAVHLAATSASPGAPALEDRVFDVTLVRKAITPTPRPIAALTPTTLRSAPLASSQGTSCCALTQLRPEETAPPPATATEAQAGVAIETLDGTLFRVAVPRDRVVAVVSMAVGCASCIRELRAWAEIYPGYQAQDVTLVVLSINPFEDAETLERVLATVGGGDAVAAIDRDGEASRALGIQSLDQTLIFNRAGQVTYSDSVPTSAATIEEVLKEALAG